MLPSEQASYNQGGWGATFLYAPLVALHPKWYPLWQIPVANEFLLANDMSNPLVHAFFVGRVLAEALSEQVGHAVTDLLSEVGKFDAEQRERLRQFTEQVLARAQVEEEAAMQGRVSAPGMSWVASQSDDLQATIDELRAEVAQLRAELQLYRSRSI